MNKQVIFLILSLLCVDISCSVFKMCNNEPVLDAPIIKDETVVSYVLKKKLTHNEALGYERFQALNTETNESVIAKLYLKSKPNMSKPNPLLQYFWTYKDDPTDPAKECQ